MIDPGMIKRLQRDLYARIEKTKEELADKEVEGTAGGGAVRVTCNGNQEVTGIQIKPEAIDPDDPEMLQDLIMAAVNQAMDHARKMNEDAMSEITGGLKLPGLF